MTYGYGPYYPDDMTGPMVCKAEGCAGPNCPRCGEINFAWLGYLGYIGRMAKKWGVSKDEAERRIDNDREQKLADIICGACGHEKHDGACAANDGWQCECKASVPYEPVLR